MPKAYSRPNAPTLTDIIQTWLKDSEFRTNWFVDARRHYDEPEEIGYISNAIHDLPIYKDFIDLGQWMPGNMDILNDANLKLHASDPKFFSKLASVLGLIQSQKARLSIVEMQFYAEDLKKMKRVLK